MIRKLEMWLFYLFIFCIPISVRHIFGYQPFNFVEWTSFYVYGTDLLFGLLLLFWILQEGRRHKADVRRRASETERESQQGFDALRRWLRPDYFLLAFILVAGISIKNALDVHVAVFQWLKLLEGAALYFYVKNYAVKRFDLTNIFVTFVASGTFQAVIAIIQFIRQGSLGLKYLGESVLVPAYSGIAAFYVQGIKIVRAYGTTPHSNVLAVFLFVAISSFYSVAIYHKRHWAWQIPHALILWAFLLTFSRVMIGLWVLNFLIRSFLIRFYRPFHKEFWENREMRQRSLRILWTTISVVILFAAVYWPYVTNRAAISSADEAVQLRVLYNHESLASAHHVFGLGIGNFVPWLMKQNLHLDQILYQPVHNIYLLIYSETGIIGAVLFVAFILTIIVGYYQRTRFDKLYHFSFALVVISVLISGAFDHLLWDIQTGRLLLFMLLGFLAGIE